MNDIGQVHHRSIGRQHGTNGEDYFPGTDKDDVFNGLASGDTISGIDGNDTLIGGDGDDWIDGGSDDDAIYGDGQEHNPFAKGEDTINGGPGLDFLWGGPLRDTFIFGDGSQMDYIQDFHASGASHDIVDLRGLSEIHDLQDLKLHAHEDQAGNVIVRIHHDSLHIQHTSVDDLHAKDFIFG